MIKTPIRLIGDFERLGLDAGGAQRVRNVLFGMLVSAA
jgi:hypothetical protein